MRKKLREIFLPCNYTQLIIKGFKVVGREAKVLISAQMNSANWFTEMNWMKTQNRIKHNIQEGWEWVRKIIELTKYMEEFSGLSVYDGCSNLARKRSR